MIIPIYLFLFIELIVVTIGDIKFRKIRNLWVIFNLIIAVSLFISFPSMYVLSIESFQFSIAFFVVGFLLFLLKIMGGGDSKFLASFFLLVPLKKQEMFFYYILMFTIIIGVFFLLKNIVQNWKRIISALKNSYLQEVKNCFGTKFAYAPVILLAWVYLGVDTFL